MLARATLPAVNTNMIIYYVIVVCYNNCTTRNKQAFLSHVSILTRDIDIANLSVRPSLTLRYQMKTA